MFNCPKCKREYKTERRMNNHMPKCKGKCQHCQDPIIKGVKFCSRECYKEFMNKNPEYRKEITKAANNKCREMGKKGLHWTQLGDEKAKSHIEMWYTGGIKNTKETILRGEFWSQKDKEKLQNAMKKIHTQEAHKKLSNSLRGRTLSDNHKRNLSKSRIEKGVAKGKNNPMYGKSPITTKGFKSGFRNDIGHYVRSTWEANFARILKLNNLVYSFEPDIFELASENNEEFTYRPDFKVGKKYYEIKGFWYDDAKYKFDLFLQQYPEIDIEVIDKEKYKELEKRYKSIIKEWE